MTTEEPEPKPPPKKENPRPWPTYGYDDARQHISPYHHRPPYKRLWTIDAHDTLEFPPTVGYGQRLPRPAEGPLLRAERQDRQGRLAQEPRPLRRLVADDRQGTSSTSPTCTPWCARRTRPGADGFVVAWDADTGRERWRYKTRADRVLAAAARQPPLRRLLGPRRARDQREDRQADLALPGRQPGEHLRRRTGTGASSSPRTAARSTRSAPRPGSCSGARRQPRAHEFLYATPTVAYGRVYIGNTDGTMYVFGAKSGKLLWARPLGSYIYGAAAVYKRQGVRGHLRRQVLRARRGHRRRALADRRARRGARGADGDERARLLRGLLELRLGGPALGGARPGRHLRGASARRQAGVAASRPASTRTRWLPTRTACTSRAGRSEYAFARKGSEVVKEYLQAAARREKRQALSDGRAARRARRAGRPLT